MKKNLIIAGVSVFLIIGVSLFFILGKKTSEQTTPTSVPDQSTLPSLPAADKNSDKISIKTNAGNVSINNPLKNPPESYGQDAVLINKSEEKGYIIDYFQKNQQIGIVITSSNIQAGRIEAENELLKALGVSKDDACKLNVNLQVFYQASPDAAGVNYGLSFCPNGKPFPTQ